MGILSMKIELVPEPGPDDPAFLAAEAAIERTGVADVRPLGNTSAWWRAGVREAVELGLEAREHEPAAGRAEAGGAARRRASGPDTSVSV